MYLGEGASRFFYGLQSRGWAMDLLCLACSGHVFAPQLRPYIWAAVVSAFTIALFHHEPSAAPANESTNEKAAA